MSHSVATSRRRAAHRGSQSAAPAESPRQATAATNAAWFDDNDLYFANQSSSSTTATAAGASSAKIKGVARLLDVGNGGFFNYDTSLIGHATAVDLFLKDGPGPLPNTSFKAGSLLDLPFADGSFDAILLQNVFHHVTGRTVRENHDNLRRCMGELHRVRAPGREGGRGREHRAAAGSTGSSGWRTAPALKIKRGGHPVTFQFTPEELLREAAGRVHGPGVRHDPQGRVAAPVRPEVAGVAHAGAAW